MHGCLLLFFILVDCLSLLMVVCAVVLNCTNKIIIIIYNRWKFLTNVTCLPISISMLFDINNLQYGHVSKLSHAYGEDFLTRLEMSVSVENYFRDFIESREQ